MLTTEEVKQIAILARIELTEEEVEKFQNELSTILTYVDELKTVNTEGLTEVSSVTGLENVFRADLPEDCEFKDELLALAPQTKDRYIKVKSIF